MGPPTHLGEALRLYRLTRRFTLRQLSEEIGIAASTLRRIEGGQSFDAATLMRIWTWLLLPDASPRAPGQG